MKGRFHEKRYVLSAVGALGAGVAGFYLKDQQNRDKIKGAANVITSKLKQNSQSDDHDHTFENSGVPDQLGEKDVAQLENSKWYQKDLNLAYNITMKRKRKTHQIMNKMCKENPGF